MPSARHASHSAPRRAPREAPRTPPRPRRISYHRPARGIRWDRLGRVALLIVIAIVAVLYVQDGIRWIKAKRLASHQGAIVSRLNHENATLAKQQQSLQQPATIKREARTLGMVQAGEHPYVVTGLPNR
jgi:cell division protein FtsB